MGIDPDTERAMRADAVSTGDAAATVTGTIVVAGVGSIGRRHLRNLLALGHGDIVLHRTGKGTLEEPLPLPVERSLEAALGRGARAVIVSNPTSLHLPTALAAARAGAHLLIEKPVAHTLEGVDTLRHELERRGLSALVGYQFRFHPTLRRVRDWVREGAIGRVVSAHVYWGEYLPGWHPWEDYRAGYSARTDLGGGVILTLSHPFDYLAWILGPVQRVSASAGRHSGLEVEAEDLAHVTLEHEDGTLSSVRLDYARRPAVHRLEVVGTAGTIEWDALTGVARRYDPDQAGWTTLEPPRGFERNTMFLDEMRHFLACLEGRESPACTLDEGIHALRVSLAAHRSAAEGTVVDV